ncbi:hypothetical protein TcWFU_006959 [Taenia crassiceps]|uniref:Uncharacterized protein n=1 Tax=Taenia crassiceps TaxID=6207 RepID=A0ABR4Q5C6_9CEST
MLDSDPLARPAHLVRRLCRFHHFHRRNRSLSTQSFKVVQKNHHLTSGNAKQPLLTLFYCTWWMCSASVLSHLSRDSVSPLSPDCASSLMGENMLSKAHHLSYISPVCVVLD